MGNSEEKEARIPSLGLAIGVIAFITFTVSMATLYYDVDVHAPIVMLAVIIALIAYFYLKISYEKLMSAALDGVMTAMPSCIILMLVGMLVSVWMRGGVIPGLIYYGLGIINPSVFPLVTLIICSIISLSTGSSWSTEATIGVAMMGIGSGLGLPPAMTAGIVVSGAYFGDKMSPLSDTTNLAPAVSGGELFDHIKAMMWTTGPTYVIFMVFLALMGSKYAGGALDTQRIEAIRSVIAGEFEISPWCIVPPLLVILLSILKVPAMPGICVGIVAGMAMCFTYGSSWGNIWAITQWGYKPDFSAQIVAAADTGAVQALLSAKNISLAPDIAQDVARMISRLVGRGGMQPMMWSVSLAIAAMAMGGFLEVSQILKVLLNALTAGIRKVGGLIGATLGACIVANFLTGSQYLAIIIPGRMFKSKYEENGLAPKLLSRTLEDSGTLTSVLIPWNVCGGYAAGVLGVPTLQYAPYAVLNWLNVLVALLLGYLGVGIYRRDENGKDFLSRDLNLKTPS
ncbi:Na+/H+ antiporter NhaC [Synergistales bacterium]|nr:Na+/H+ antiporter NhaC [Synergistales bacterium]